MISLDTIFIATLVIVSILSLAITIMLYLFRLNRDREREAQQNRVLIDSIRGSFERQLYEVNERLMATQERWRDVNHLLISSQQSNQVGRQKYATHLSEFLKAAALTEADLEVDKTLVFVLTPFHERYQKDFAVIQSACQEVGLRVMRGDEEHVRGDILHHILRTMARASIVIANIDGRNPNVFYELGLAHAMDKRTILISRSVQDLPIDIKSKRIVVYDELETLRWRLKDELAKLLISQE